MPAFAWLLVIVGGTVLAVIGWRWLRARSSPPEPPIPFRVSTVPPLEKKDGTMHATSQGDITASKATPSAAPGFTFTISGKGALASLVGGSTPASTQGDITASKPTPEAVGAAHPPSGAPGFPFTISGKDALAPVVGGSIPASKQSDPPMRAHSAPAAHGHQHPAPQDGPIGIRDESRLRHRLREAAEAGEVLTIVYHGGSQPGSKREISPIRVASDEVLARDLAAQQVKMFMVPKIEVVPENYPAPAYVPGAITASAFSTPEEALHSKIEEIEALGWHVNITGNSVTVHRFFKNGKPRKGAEAGLLNCAVQFHDDDGLVQSGNPVRPWYVFGPGLAMGRTFSHLDRAVDLFLEQVRHYAPKGQADEPR